ncbi:MAG: hypothetical protein EOO52_13070 [Gammaproteobacteria bacterium]|nr:MAG: hypothetical protein EOO52_13070 [Gammaproteobacteria bacterium]
MNQTVTEESCRGIYERLGWSAYLRNEALHSNPFTGKTGGHVEEDAWNIGFELARSAVCAGLYIPTEEDRSIDPGLPSGEDYLEYLKSLLDESLSFEDRRRIARKIAML